MAHRRGPGSRTGSRFALCLEQQPQEDGMVGGHRDDTEPGEPAAAVGPLRIPEVGEVEAEPCISNPVAI